MQEGGWQLAFLCLSVSLGFLFSPAVTDTLRFSYDSQSTSEAGVSRNSLVDRRLPLPAPSERAKASYPSRFHPRGSSYAHPGSPQAGRCPAHFRVRREARDLNPRAPSIDFSGTVSFVETGYDCISDLKVYDSDSDDE